MRVQSPIRVTRWNVMLHFHTWFVALVVFAASADASPDGSRFVDAGAHAVTVELDTWHDAARQRDVPVKLYVPDGDHRLPVVLFSHGLGGTRDAAGYLGEHWASHGYLVVAMQHAGSDDAVWRGAPPDRRMRRMREATQRIQPALDRMGDAGFVLDELERLADDVAGGPGWADRLDLDRVAMAGHSFGAWTTLAVGGRTMGTHRARGGAGVRRADPRIDALLPLSPPPPKAGEDADAAFGSITLPIMVMTGSLDDSPLTGATADGREAVFDHLNGSGGGGGEGEGGGEGQGGPAYLVYLEGGDHAVFGGSRRWRGGGAAGDPSLDPTFHAVIRAASLAFLEAHLRGDAGAAAWLEGGGPSAVAPRRVRFEVK